MILEVRQLAAFYERAQVLFDVTLRVAAGEVVVLVGRNGAGKSTTLRSIIGLVDRRRGRILFQGRDVVTMSVDRIARLGLGYVPEERRIFTDLTVAENLQVGARRPPPGRQSSLPPGRQSSLPLWTLDRVCTLFPKLAELMARPAGALSGGEQQMLTIARTLMGNPALIMLDEPSEGLAPKVVAQMADAVSEMKRSGLSVLLAEQNVHFARAVGDRAYILERGTIRMEGAAIALLGDEGITRTYLAV